MSAILRKLKGKSLFQQLGETFSTEIVNPYGLVVIVPSKQFKNEWKEKLEGEGILRGSCLQTIPSDSEVSPSRHHFSIYPKSLI